MNKIIDACKSESRLSLYIKDASSLNDNVLELIVNHISPKMIEISVIDCTHSFTFLFFNLIICLRAYSLGPFLAWSVLKKILEPASCIEYVNLQKNPWVDDSVIEQISKKFSKYLKEINLEYTKVTDGALNQIGGRCLNVRTIGTILTHSLPKLISYLLAHIGLTCCSRVGDPGFSALAKKLHISTLQISHNVNITDESTELVLSASSDLHTLILKNCPKLTDRTIEALFQKIVSWGKRRNTKSASLLTLDISDNPNFSLQAIVFLTTAAPKLNKLDISECSNMDIMKVVVELETLKFLEHLYLGIIKLSTHSLTHSLTHSKVHLKIKSLTQNYSLNLCYFMSPT